MLVAVGRNHLWDKMTLSHQDFVEMRQLIEALNAEFAWLIDHQDGAGVEELFTASGVYDMSNRLYRGRGEIKGFYDARKSRGRRAARHVFTNLRLMPESAGRATGTVILLLYACDGEPPYPTDAILIADYEDVYVREGDGSWRYESRAIVPVFGGVPVLAGPGSKPVGTG
jgi:SnoaL-like domain